jgi:hypothetical protein
MSWDMLQVQDADMDVCDEETEEAEFPVATWAGTPFELGRIFVKCLSDKSKYGNAANGYAKSMLPTEVWRTISSLGRIVGTRSLQRVKGAGVHSEANPSKSIH